jgi:hypothetical protein
MLCFPLSTFIRNHTHEEIGVRVSTRKGELGLGLVVESIVYPAV